MKNSDTCPKCASTDVINFLDKSPSGRVPSDLLNLYPVFITRYICMECGYMEQWIESPEEREWLRKRHTPDWMKS